MLETFKSTDRADRRERRPRRTLQIFHGMSGTPSPTSVVGATCGRPRIFSKLDGRLIIAPTNCNLLIMLNASCKCDGRISSVVGLFACGLEALCFPEFEGFLVNLGAVKGEIIITLPLHCRADIGKNT